MWHGLAVKVASSQLDDQKDTIKRSLAVHGTFNIQLIHKYLVN